MRTPLARLDRFRTGTGAKDLGYLGRSLYRGSTKKGGRPGLVARRPWRHGQVAPSQASLHRKMACINFVDLYLGMVSAGSSTAHDQNGHDQTGIYAGSTLYTWKRNYYDDYYSATWVVDGWFIVDFGAGVSSYYMGREICYKDHGEYYWVPKYIPISA